MSNGESLKPRPPKVQGLATLVVVGMFLFFCFLQVIDGQTPEPTMLHPNLAVKKVAGNLITPITMAFLGPDDLLLLEKNTGNVQRVIRGAVAYTALDLAVNFASERGLLGIALHPDFPANPGVYLYWTCRTAGPPPDSFFPEQESCSTVPELGVDTDNILAVPLLANRVDRFVWNQQGTLTFDRNLITIRQFQNDAAPTPPGQRDQLQPARGNHDGGVLCFGKDVSSMCT